MPTSFPNITENLALNFINSTINRNDNHLELMTDIKSLKKWSETPMNIKEYNFELSVFNSLLSDTESIKEIQVFRDDLHDLLSELAKNEAPVSVLANRIESFLIENPFSIIFIDNQVVSIPTATGILGLKSLIYLSLADLIRTGEIEYLTCCANEKCPLLFINQSRRRKWCSMKICGNRNKVERFENKQKRREFD